MRSMDVNKYLALQERLMGDEEYLSLLEEYRAMDRRFVAALEEMAPAHREIVMDYVGAVHTANARMLEISLASAENS